jgi:hypothetical protein
MGVSRSLAALTCVALLAPLAGAQQASRADKRPKGNLKGVTEVWLDAKGDELLRELLAREIRRQIPGLTLAESGTPGALVVEVARGFIERKEAMGSASGLGEPAHQVADRFQLQAPAAPGESQAQDLERLRARPRVTRECWVFGAVLRPADGGGFAEVFRYRHIVSRGLESMARDFVGKLAKEYRKANPERPALVAVGPSR